MFVEIEDLEDKRVLSENGKKLFVVNTCCQYLLSIPAVNTCA